MEAACSFATQFSVEAARIHANAVRKHFSDLPPIVRDDLFAVDALIAIYADQPENLVEIAERGLRGNEAHDPYTVGTLHLSEALGFVVRGRLDRARQAALRARNDNDAAANPFGIALSHMVLGLIHAVEGNLPAAAGEWSTADKVIQGVAQFGFVDSVAIGYLPEIYYEWNLLAETEQYLDRCLGGPIEIMTPDMVTSAYLTAARLANAKGAAAEAHANLDALETIALEKAWPRARYAVDWERVRLCLQAKDYEQAKRRREAIVDHGFAEAVGISTHALETEADLIGQLRFEGLVAPNPAVFSCLQAAVARALTKNRKWRAAKLLVVEAVARQTAGDHNAALRTMCSALRQAATGKLVRTFIDEGPVAAALVEEIADSEIDGTDGVSREYLQTILTAAGSNVLPKMEESPAVAEALSDRETDVLRLVFHGCSNADAAKRLFVSENTVKWHLQHIYSKLGVKNRTAAVAAARSLNLVR
jgi:LuxR family maltose regulon positive regulatory protein